MNVSQNFWICPKCGCDMLQSIGDWCITDRFCSRCDYGEGKYKKEIVNYNTAAGIKKKIAECPRNRKICPYYLLPCSECLDIILPDEEKSISIDDKPKVVYKNPEFNYFGEGGDLGYINHDGELTEG